MTEKSSWPSIKTTLPVRPLPPNSSRPHVTTGRLLIRPLAADDVQALHVLRTQPEVMANSSQIRADRDLDETYQRLAPFLPPNDEKTFHCAICLRETGEMIGIGGCHSLSSGFGWPVLGYMIRREYWGRGLVTEFVGAWLGMWCALPREETEVVASPDSLLGDDRGDGRAGEVLVALTTSENVASQKVLEKSGFEHFMVWKEPDLRDPKVDIELRGYRYVVPCRETAR
ncbi:Acyl-CoA N-acyltransferase [Coniochaeta hoffmannii]|uniref:Acyl-CoA N-acyltransferase n=1 Tax=Coniochaeta hoffmannii TaxID=91930 RepID=A0AA38SBN4_9PEZI|nr:Acyl-CoA N-acyltransferase [Coniochaeta hoffmannii]